MNGKPTIATIGDTIGRINPEGGVTVYHAHGVHYDGRGGFLKGHCALCGYDYDESEYGMPPGVKSWSPPSSNP